MTGYHELLWRAALVMVFLFQSGLGVSLEACLQQQHGGLTLSDLTL